MPRTPRNVVVAAALAFGLVAALAGCDAGSAALPSASPAESTEEPIFASDAEALAAAEDAYAAYSEINDIVGSDGGDDVQRLKGLVGDEIYRESEDFFDQLIRSQLATIGRTEFSGFVLVEHREESERAVVAAYFCRDVSGVRIVDDSGTDVTPATRDPVQSMLGTFGSTSGEPDRLVVESLRTRGDGPC